MTADPFDYPEDAAESCPKPEPPPVTRPPVDHDDDESAFWRDVREGADRPPPPEHQIDHSSYVEWIASERRVAYTVRCPICIMDVGVPCIRIDDHGRPIEPPQPLRKLPAHDARLKLARKSRP